MVYPDSEGIISYAQHYRQTFQYLVDVPDHLDADGVTRSGGTFAPLVGTNYGYKIYPFEPVDPNAFDSCPDVCIFEVFEDGELIFKETRSECPTNIEVIGCQLNFQDEQTITVSLDPLEIFYVSEGVSDLNDIALLLNVYLSVLSNSPLPDSLINLIRNFLGGNQKECLILWIFSVPLQIFKVAQFCSDFNCPSPQIEVICKETETIEKCPEGTCAIDCRDYICCYNSEGIAIKTINK